MSIGDVGERKDRPSFVRFERVAEEDLAATKLAGHYVARDVDYAFITAPYSKDVFTTPVKDWLEQNAAKVNMGRIPQQWADQYKTQYVAWQNGQEMPLVGTPIKGWGVISPAQQETLIRMHVMTVEDLAAINDEGIKRIGMGGVDLKIKANGWLKQLADKGPLTIEIAAVKGENALLKTSIQSLEKQVAGLMEAVKHQHVEPSPAYQVQTSQTLQTEISSADILEDPAVAYQAKFGKLPHHRMKPETILAALKE